MKCVVSVATKEDEIVSAAALLHDLGVTAPLILQPVTVAGLPNVPGNVMLDLQQLASRVHAEVRVIPQVHPLLKVN